MKKYIVSDGFPYYIEQLENKNYLEQFSLEENFNLLNSLTEEKANSRFAKDKWNIKQIIGHITDHERIMIYRILRISRKDNSPLEGYDQELLVANSRFDELSLNQLMEDYKNVRKSTLSFINTLSEEQLNLTGFIWKFEMTVEDFLKATIGHELHHIKIIKEKYLSL